MGYSAKKLIKIIKLQDINHDCFDYDTMSEIKIALSLNGLISAKNIYHRSSLDDTFYSRRI